MAAGFSLNEDKIEEFRKFAGEYVQERLGKEAIVPVVEADGVLDVGGQRRSWPKNFPCWSLLAPRTPSRGLFFRK